MNKNKQNNQNKRSIKLHEMKKKKSTRHNKLKPSINLSSSGDNPHI